MAAGGTQSSAISIGAAVVLLIVGLIWYAQQAADQRPLKIPGPSAGPGEYLFCFWNAENLFDDQDNPKDDDDLEDWLGQNPDIVQQKLHKNAEVLLAMNGGRGPDIIALVEVENERAANLLKDVLNSKLTDTSLHYTHVAMKEVKVGRNIAPALITRLPLVGDRTTQVGAKSNRILKTHLRAAERELIVITAHWTSRIKRKDGTSGEDQRAGYGDDVYGEVKGIVLANPKVDILVCGDFNDDPTDVSVTQHLRSTGDEMIVRGGGADVQLFNLMANRDPQTFGTHYHGKWHIFDQIVVSPGLLDQEGWTCNTQSLQTVKRLAAPGGGEISLVNPKGKIGQPWYFGRAKDYNAIPAARGYSDHFPVTVTLGVKQ